MAQFVICYSDRETIVDGLTARAVKLNISPEQLIKRLVDEGMREDDKSASAEASSSNEFFMKNGVLKSDSE